MSLCQICLIFSVSLAREKMACFELCDSPVLTQNPDIWNFNGSLTFNKRKLEFLKSSICHCVRYDYFFIQLDMRKKIGLS